MRTGARHRTPQRRDAVPFFVALPLFPQPGIRLQTKHKLTCMLKGIFEDELMEEQAEESER